jgi:YidC/Oxa1 family membrane protein insertase
VGLNSAVLDSVNNIPEKIIKIETQDLNVHLSSKGATLKLVSLKKHKSYDDYQAGLDKPLTLFDENKSEISLKIPTTKGLLDLKTVSFDVAEGDLKIGEKETKEILFKAVLENGSTIEKKYIIKGTGYEIENSIKVSNVSGFFTNVASEYVWSSEIQKLENDLEENRKAAQINYYDKEENFEDIGFSSTNDDKEISKLPVKWFSFKQKYFTEGVVMSNAYFNNADFTLLTPVDESIVKKGLVKASIASEDLFSGKTSLKYYFGPNELTELREVADGFQQNLYLGYDIVKPINRYVFVPLFNWVESFISNYGLLIVIVVLIIKFALTPLIYKSYVSSAKMRLLAPEINEIKERVGDDAVKVQQETMKLYQQVGVSPLSGCVPLLLQMPILMSVFFLFPNMSMFRQKSFWWSNDLSTFDAPISWATTIPIVGNHISLFVVLMTISSLAFTYYNNQITPDQPGPIDMKKISYVFPLVFFFVLNSFPAALSFYYLVSNLVTIGQQLLVRKFIDEDKIRSILETNRINYHTKPQKKSKFGEFIQKQLQASEEMKRQSDEIKKTRKKK